MAPSPEVILIRQKSLTAITAMAMAVNMTLVLIKCTMYAKPQPDDEGDQR